MTSSTTSIPARSAERRFSPGLLVGGAFAFTTLLNIAVHVGQILFTDYDRNDPEGPIASVQSISFFGALGLVLALAVAVPLSRDPQRAKVGAIVLGSLAVVTLPFFWSGAPAALGACAAWLGGLTRGSHPQTGAARGFGVVGLVITILVIVATVFGLIVGQFE